ncbi:MAG TPA: hypothetical protein V6C71_18800 [Coleofasciculaceae cyanobacterium]
MLTIKKINLTGAIALGNYSFSVGSFADDPIICVVEAYGCNAALQNEF